MKKIIMKIINNEIWNKWNNDVINNNEIRNEI